MSDFSAVLLWRAEQSVCLQGRHCQENRTALSQGGESLSQARWNVLCRLRRAEHFCSKAV